MAKNKISDLRDHLFETLEALKDKENPMELERAKMISSVAQTIINAAKVEVEMVNAVGGDAPTFFEHPPADRSLPAPKPQPHPRAITAKAG